MAGYKFGSTNTRRDTEGHTHDLIQTHMHRHTLMLQIKDKMPNSTDNVQTKKDLFSVIYTDLGINK